MSIFDDSIKSFISISKFDARKRSCARGRAAGVLYTESGEFLVFEERVEERKAIKIAKHYTDLSVGLVLRFFFAQFRSSKKPGARRLRRDVPSPAFYSHNLIISALRPGTTSSSGLDPSTITPHINSGERYRVRSARISSRIFPP